MMELLAQNDVTVQEVKGSYKDLIFMGCFIIAAILIGIWWLKRNA